MKKLLVIMLMIALFLCGCGKNKATNSPSASTSPNETQVVHPITNYSIEKAEYKEQGITINYPVITNVTGGDEEHVNALNETIKSSATAVLKDFDGDYTGLTYTLDYEVEYKGVDYLSVVYMGSFNIEGAAHPNNVLHTTNLDIKNNKLIFLSDAVEVSENFAQKFKEGTYLPYSDDLNIAEDGYLDVTIDGFKNEELVNTFNMSRTNFYFTGEALVVSVEIAYAAGNHLEMIISYDSLGEMLKIKPVNQLA
jgi:hypothetical protein